LLDDSQRRDFMERVGRAGHSLQELLEDTLAASAFEAGALEPRPQEVDLGAVLREVLNALSDPLDDLDIEQPEHRVDVHVDRGHLKQVLSNVVSNAAKYGAAPYRIVVAAGPDGVQLRVVDHGPGVSPEFVPHLFDRYSRSEEARRGSQGGTGLGLFIARALLQASGGDIAYERGADGASTFVLRLPGVPHDTVGTVGTASPRAEVAPDRDSSRMQAV
jgi:signal transduction histidine kinase